MDLDDAEGWFTYWETIGTRFDEGDADERAAAQVLHAEHDRRGVALADAHAEIARLRHELEPYEILTPQVCPAGEHPEWLIDSERHHACPWCEIARLRAAVDVHALAEEIHDAIVGAGGDCPDVDDGNDSMCEHVAERIVRALAAAPAPAEDEDRDCPGCDASVAPAALHRGECYRACGCDDTAREQADPADETACTCDTLPDVLPGAGHSARCPLYRRDDR